MGGGAKRIVRFWGGGGGERTIERPLQNNFGLVCARSSKENHMEWTNGGQNVS